MMPSTDRAPCVSQCKAHSHQGPKHARFTDEEAEAANKTCSFAVPGNSKGPELVLNQGAS